MKKLLSICFLSILLGLLSFSTQAQSNGSSCASGFWVENLQPTTIHEIANLPADMPNTGDLPLTHTLGQLWYGSTGQYLGNAHPGQTELYELHFCNTCGLDPKTKLSIDWLVIRDGDTINDHLSDYMEFSIFTFYNQLNQYGECQSIGWLGGQVNDGFGYCEPVNPNGYTLYDSIHGLNTGCHTPTNYPGALQATQGTPYGVLTQLGQVVPAMGPYHIYTEALDYFYLDFFTQTRNIVQIKWKQVGDYKLVMRIRERVGGTPYMNLNWNQNETTDFIGGHQSCCGNIIAEDVISFPVFGSAQPAVCQQETWPFGLPLYTFNSDLSDRSYDTNIVFGQYVGFGNSNEECKYFQTDSIYYVNFFVRHTPVIVVKDTNLCRCETPDVMASITVDTVGLHDTQCSYKIQWMHSDAKWYDEQGYYTKYPDSYSTPPASWNGDTTYTYIVRQINTYDDTLDCVGPQAQFTVTLKEMLAPVITSPAADTLEFCIEAIDATTSLNLAARAQDDCGTTIHWYTKLRSPFYYNSLSIGNTFTSYIDKNSNLEGATPQVFLANYLPSVNKDTTLYFFATSYNEGQGCESRKFDYFVVLIHQTPELTPHITKTVYCQHDNVEMRASIGNNPPDTDPNYTFVWTGVTSVDHVNPAPAPANLATEAEVSGTTKKNNGYLPLYSYYNNNYSQQIFTPAEVPAGNINKLAFNYYSTTALNNNTNVEIYLTTTDKNTVASKSDFVTNGLVMVYSGVLNAKQGWNELEFTTPYTYNGEKNLVLIVKSSSATTPSNRYFTSSTTTDVKSMSIYSDSPIPADPTTVSSYSVHTYQYRSDVKFTVVPAGAYTTSDNYQYAYNQLDTTGHQCGDTLRSSVYVVDGNGCTSQPVNFVYVMNDTIAPTVTGAIATTRVNACKLDATNTFHYNSIADLPASITIKDDAVVPGDNCGFPDLTMTYSSTYKDGDCEDTLTYNYVVTDWCGHTATFSHTFISHDSVYPEFRTATGAFPYVRLTPKEAGNCTFNSPDSMDFVNAVAPFVYDNCTDSAYLMSTLTFNWENTNESPIGKTNIFLEKNHLTVEASITDSCGNTTKQLVIYIDRPDKIKVMPGGITANANICFNDTVHMTFDPSYIKDDTIMGPFVPYTYSWSEKNGKTGVHFDDNTALTTNITFDEPGDYVFVMTVTDRNGCSAESEPINVNVRALPNVVINHIVLNGQTEPYCPTYGNLTVEAEIVNPVAGQTVARNAYVWSGESVNIHSDSARTWVTIVPEWCDTLYYPMVTVTDDRGCVNSVIDTVNVASSGPQFVGTIADTTVEKQAGCIFKIPDFRNLVNAALVHDDCYTFSQIKYKDAYGTIERDDWYSQYPDTNALLTANSQVVTITIKNPCGKTNTLNVNILKPTDVLTVSIAPTIDSVCQEDVALTGVTYTASVTNELPAGSETYNWELIVKPAGSTATIPTSHTSADLNVKQALEAGLYQYKVNVEDGLGCTASDTAELYVKFQGADPIVRTWPNTLCDRYNGALAVDTAPTGYAYILEDLYYHTYTTKISDVPAHQQTQWNTIVFDSLRPGDYKLTVITNEGCERAHQPYTIQDVSAAPSAPTYTKNDVTTCDNNNGEIHVNGLAGFTYALYRFDATSTPHNLGELIGEGVDFTALSTDSYVIAAMQTSTHCPSFALVELLDNAPRPQFDLSVTHANNYCPNPAGTYNGVIKITSNDAGNLYTVYTIDGVDTTYVITDGTLAEANNKLTGLNNGVTYYVEAYNSNTHCATTTAKYSAVNHETVTVTLTANPTANNFCVNPANIANGTVKISTLSNFVDYNLLLGTDTVAKKADYTTNGWTALAHGVYNIKATDKYFCPASKTGIQVKHDTVNPYIVATPTMNPSCVKNLGEIKLEVKNANANYPTTADNKMNQSKYGNAHIANYHIEMGTFEQDSTTTLATVTFKNLATGTYSYVGTTNYNCKVNGTVTIDEYQLPTMLLDSTPNHMCASTFEKPGDGTIKIRRPIVGDPTGNHFFEYKFFDAAGNEMTVPYDLPLTKTKYWLAAGYYHVLAIDTVSGCTVDGYITVEDSLYNVDFDYTTTPNYICGTSAVGNGTITVTNPTSTNPDANLGVFVYSMDGTNYQTNPTFTGLKDGVYTLYVKDTTYQCEKIKNNVIVNATDSCAPVITICDNNNVCGDQFDYCYDATGIQLCGTVNDTCNPTNIYTYGWYAPCANPHASNTACIDVQTNHYVVNGCDYIFTATNTATGCTYSKTVNVAIHPNPTLYFTINGNPAATDHTNSFCENEELHIAVHPANPTEVVLDTTSIEWTQPAFIVGTGFADFSIKGDTITPDNITFCVRANSKFGCPSIIYSLPVTFKRIAHVNVPIVACESCQIQEPSGSYTTITKPATATYPYTTTEIRNYTSVLTGCDSVVTYNITLNGAPQFTAAPTIVPFCEDENKTLADFELPNDVNWNGSTGSEYWMAAPISGTYEVVASTQALTYDYVNNHTIKRVAENSCGTDEEILNLNGNVSKKPAVVALPTVNPYCAGSPYNFTATVTSYGTQGGAKLFADGVQIGDEKTFNGASQVVDFGTITVSSALDGKNLTLKVYNKNGLCDTVTVDSVLHVYSTNFPTVTNNATPYCVGDQIEPDDFEGIPAGYTDVTFWKKGTPDQEISLPYPLTNSNIGTMEIYVKANASICFTGLTSNTVTVTVKGKPVVTPHADINQCATSFTALPDMSITWNESYDAAVCDSGWLLKGASGAYAAATFDQIKAAATCPNVAHVGYYAKGFCGSDTAKFDITLATLPSVSLAIGTQCPGAIVWDSLTTNTKSYNCSPDASNSDTWYFTKGSNTWNSFDFSTLTFAAVKTAGYDGGTLTHSVTNSCGTSTASVTINVLTNAYTDATYQPSCDGDTLGAFVATAPVWTGTASVGNTGKWQIKIGSTTTDATLATVINYADNPQVAYTWTTQCGDVVTTPFTALTINQKPELTMKSVAAVCDGQSIDPASSIDHVTYYGNEDKYDTAYTVDGVAITSSTPLTYAYNGKYLVVALNDNGQACGIEKDSVIITVNPLPNPTITGPAKVCADQPLTSPFVASAGYINYVFDVDGGATSSIAVPTSPSTSNTFNPTFSLSTPLSVAFDTIYVTVEDPTTHCVGTSSTPAIIRVTNAPEFIFIDSTNTETHTFSTLTGGDGLAYTWMVNVDCYPDDKLVYVEYDIYYNDVLIPNANIGDYLNTQHTAATPGHPAKDYVTKNFYEWCATDGTSRSDEILYNYSMANPSVGVSGNHFPYSNLGLGTGHNYLDDLWLSFLADRPVKKTFVPFLTNGDYKVVYRLMATANNQQLNEYYSPSCAPITDLLPIGGHSALASGYAQTLLAIDSITIHVGGPNLAPSTSTTDEETVAPEMAPVITDVETVAPDMEVWPNPAPAVETTLKARVHNLSGNATVTLTNLSGKQVYSGEIFIDNDNFYFEFNINALSVGSYIMTVRTDTDVITKKVIISRLAK